MLFTEYSRARLDSAGDLLREGLSVDEWATKLLNAIFSEEAVKHDVYPEARIERRGRFGLLVFLHQCEVEGIFEHILIGEGVGGRWVFRMKGAGLDARLSGVPIFSIELDSSGQLRFGTEGPWRGWIEANPNSPWKYRHRIVLNIAAAVQDAMYRKISCEVLPPGLKLSPSEGNSG